MDKYCVRVIDLAARRERLGILEVTDHLYIVAENKQKARKGINKQLTEQGLVYGRDFVLGRVCKYTGKGVSVGFGNDVFKNSLPHHTFIAYDWKENKEEKTYGYQKVEHKIERKALPNSYLTEKYVIQDGKFVVKK